MAAFLVLGWVPIPVTKIFISVAGGIASYPVTIIVGKSSGPVPKSMTHLILPVNLVVRPFLATHPNSSPYLKPVLKSFSYPF